VAGAVVWLEGVDVAEGAAVGADGAGVWAEAARVSIAASAVVRLIVLFMAVVWFCFY
jgi:hypothetical protein